MVTADLRPVFYDAIDTDKVSKIFRCEKYVQFVVPRPAAPTWEASDKWPSRVKSCNTICFGSLHRGKFTSENMK